MSSLVLNPEYPNTHHIVTDGSFRPSNAASCAYLIYHQRTKSIVKMSRYAFRGYTINQMELMAINVALDYPNLKHVIIYTDSSYVIGCMTTWRKTWIKNKWVNPLGQPVKNKELIIELGKKIDALKFCRFVKVKAHTGDPHNTTVDFLATELSRRMIEDPNLPDGEYPV